MMRPSQIHDTKAAHVNLLTSIQNRHSVEIGGEGKGGNHLHIMTSAMGIRPSVPCLSQKKVVQTLKSSDNVRHEHVQDANTAG